MFQPRAYLVLGRVSNISTLWSNGLCAWLLGGGGDLLLFVAALLGLTLIYVGGMYLNDYCDADWDREFRSERPIPSGQVTRPTALLAVVLFFITGMGCLLWSGWQTFPAAAVLLVLVVLYNVIHKRTVLAIPLMAACRTAVYWVVGAIALQGVTPEVGLAGILMFLYVMGITWLARDEAGANPNVSSTRTGTATLPGSAHPVVKQAWRGRTPSLAFIFLAAPVLAMAILGLQNPGFELLAVALVAAWMFHVFRGATADGHLKVGKTIGPLLAGICWVDLAILACLGFASVAVGAGYAAFFLMALTAQRFIPAS